VFMCNKTQFPITKLQTFNWF